MKMTLNVFPQLVVTFSDAQMSVKSREVVKPGPLKAGALL